MMAHSAKYFTFIFVSLTHPQEFLQGTEYAIDGVTRDGVYKVTAIWEYDKRFANGANFVYFGMRLRSGAGEREKAIVAYSQQVFTELTIK